MKRIVSGILIFSIIVSTANITFAEKSINDELLNFDVSTMDNGSKLTYINEISDTEFKEIEYETSFDKSCVPDNKSLSADMGCTDDENIRLFSNTEFSFNSDLLTSFNTVTGPTAGNGANEPKFSYNSFLEENISDYSGELTLNFEDLVLDGVNGFNLRIGRTYQTVASNIGERTLMILPDENGRLEYHLVDNYSSYLSDRYNLGMGWGFSFPSVQIETEYIPEEVDDTYYYDEETELYYHTGNGEVYQVQFTDDTTDSNLKGYYKKDIQFNQNDTAFTNGQTDSDGKIIRSYYSMTLSDKTKQYFAKDGRLLGIADRFGNTIKFEHSLQCITNRVPGGNFRYDNEMWTSSEASDGTNDAVCVSDDGRNDSYSMYFIRNNENNNSYIYSQPVQVKPWTEYNFGVSVKSPYASDVKVEIIGYDTAYSIQEIKEFSISDYSENSWYDFSETFKTSSAVRYVVIKISPENAKYMYIDNVTLDEPKPLISNITDSIGRNIDFTYTGDLFSGNATGTVTLTVTSPDGGNTRTLTYNKEAVEFTTKHLTYDEQRLHWYLSSSLTEGEDGADVKYEYKGGTTSNEDGTLTYPKLYRRYDTKVHSSTHGWANKPVISSVRYKDRAKIYVYEPVRKHLGDDGYFDTLRIKKKYDMYAYVPDGATVSSYTGEIGAVNYSYGGTYNNNSFDNETGYPDYTFNEDTELNEQWTVTKTGKTTDTITFSNCAVVQQTNSSGGTTVKTDYTNHSVFKNSPTEIKNTITQNGSSRNSYILYSYNDWGGVATESKEIDEAVKNNAGLLEKYKTSYEYNSDYHFITQKSFYNNINNQQVEKYTYNSLGLLTESENAANEKINYYYENTSKPYSLTKTVQKDPMGFHTVMGGDRVVSYAYDTYGLYPTSVTKIYDGGTSQTQYIYDYITGDILREILPDNSYTDYTYYSDGKIKTVVSPFSLYIDGRYFYTIEQHVYSKNIICENYDTVTPVYDVEQITKYRVFSGDTTAGRYSIDINFYDAVGNLKMNQKYDLSKTDSNNQYERIYTKYYHDNYDRLIKTVDDEGNTSQYSYDGFNRLSNITDSENNVYSYTYDLVENKVDLTLNGITEPTDRNLMTRYYDLYGNVIENRVYPDNVVSDYLSESYEYDLNNNVTKYTDANGNITRYSYDGIDRLTQTILPNGVKVSANYSAFNKPVYEKVYDTDGTEKSARISYRNEKGDLKAKFFNFDNKYVDYDSYSSDAKGRTTYINEGINPKSVTYDETDNPIVITGGQSQIHRRYNWFGEMASASTDGNTPQVNYGYDGLGNVSTKIQNNTHYIEYEYSTTGNISGSIMPSERSESYTYTDNGNLDTITSDGKAYDYDYYDTGFIKSITYPGNLKTEYEYDNINRVTEIATSKNNNVINQFEYEYDNNGNVIKETRNNNETSYSYDSLNRLISVTYSDGSSVSYEYDATNNRTKETYSNGDVKDYVYNDKYQLEEIKLNGETVDTFTYNETGAVTSHNTKTFTYDEWDRMSGYSDGENTYTYKYDANGIRTQKNDKQYIVDINNNVVAETDSTGAVVEETLWGHQPLARKTNGTWYYYIYNAHGDVVGMVNDAGTVVNTYEYTPWGEIKNETEAIDNPIKYAGEYYDDELDMIYLRARYYNPKTSRMISEDPAHQGMNWYVYCNNNPLKYVDPSGLYYLEKDANGQVYAVIESGDTLSNISYSEVADANAYLNLNYADPGYLEIGQLVNITGIYNNAYTIPTNILLSKTSHTQGDSGLRDVSDEEISRLARDKSLSGEQRRRYQREEKLRGQRNKQKRQSHYSIEQSELQYPNTYFLPDNSKAVATSNLTYSQFWGNVGTGIITIVGVAAGIYYFCYTGDTSAIYQYAR